jgi:hypothetical protein
MVGSAHPTAKFLKKDPAFLTQSFDLNFDKLAEVMIYLGLERGIILRRFA